MPEMEIVEAVEQPSLTYRLNFEDGTIDGQIDGLKAIEQAVVKILQTRRFDHLIYSSDYGHELDSVIGRDPLWAYSELERLIEEAILQDDRIVAVENIRIFFHGERAMAEFTVKSAYGLLHMTKEVSKDV